MAAVADRANRHGALLPLLEGSVNGDAFVRPSGVVYGAIGYQERLVILMAAGAQFSIAEVVPLDGSHNKGGDVVVGSKVKGAPVSKTLHGGRFYRSSKLKFPGDAWGGGR
jgi:hypothetical protein